MNYPPQFGAPSMGGRPGGPMTHAPISHYNDPAAYGAMGPALPGQVNKPPSAFSRGLRRRMNAVSIATSLFVPWGLFSVIFAVMSFSMHYNQPLFTYTLVGLGFVCVCASG